MTKQEIIDYVMTTPSNPNKAVLEGMLDSIADASGGSDGESKPLSDVNFIDYDGKVVESYTKDEFLAMSAMPNNPSHDELIAQGWNWSFEDAQTYVEANDKLIVGQMYVTDDGATRLYCRFNDGRLHPYVGICLDGTVEIDWGDGSEKSVLTGASLTTPSFADHIYASEGDYTISLAVTDGSFAFGGTSVTSYILRKSDKLDTSSTSGTPANEHRAYASRLLKVEMGNNASFASNAFYNCVSLSSITIPSTVDDITSNAFYGCDSLKSVTLPSAVTSVGSSAFSVCHSLESIALSNGITEMSSKMLNADNALKLVTIPNSVGAISTDVFGACHALASITIPSNVTAIAKAAFASCYGLAECHLKSDTPPSITNTTFSSVPADCIFYVPQGALPAYQAATNWSTYASQMREVIA